MAAARALGGSLGAPAAALPQRGERQTGTLSGRSRRPRDRRRRQRLNPPIWFLLLPEGGSQRQPAAQDSELSTPGRSSPGTHLTFHFPWLGL